MAFWGAEVRSGRPVTHNGGGARLRISQATLGTRIQGGGAGKCVLQTNVGHNAPVRLCNLIPDTFETCQLNVEFEESEDVVFSVIGPMSVHISGYFKRRGGTCDAQNDSEDCHGEDIQNPSDRSSDDDEEESLEASFINDGDPDYVSDSVEVIHKTSNRRNRRRRLRKAHVSSDGSFSNEQCVSSDAVFDSELEAQNEDNMPLTSLLKKSTKSNSKKEDGSNEDKEEDGSIEDKASDSISDGNPVSHFVDLSHEAIDNAKQENITDDDIVDPFYLESSLIFRSKPIENENNSETPNRKRKLIFEEIACGENSEAEKSLKQKKKKKRKRNSKAQAEEKNCGDNTLEDELTKEANNGGMRGKLAEEHAVEPNSSEVEACLKLGKSPHVEAFPKKLVVEDLEVGSSKSRIAALGKKITVSYIGKWKTSGEVFDTNDSLKFVLGGEGVLESWNVGLAGMRSGGSRRLIIPYPVCMSNDNGDGTSVVEDDGNVVTIPPLPPKGENVDRDGGVVYDIQLLKVRKH